MLAGLPWWTIVIAVCLCVIPVRTPRLGIVVGIATLVASGVILAAAGQFAPHWLSYERWIGYQLAGYGAAWIAIGMISQRLQARGQRLPVVTLRRK